MSKTNDGGPAFPTAAGSAQTGYYSAQPSQGMSLRDYLAGQALATLSGFSSPLEEEAPRDLANDAYRIADAMIEARNQ